MKKIQLMLLVLFASVLFSLPASAQVRFGVRGPARSGVVIGGNHFRVGIGIGAGFRTWGPGFAIAPGYGCVDMYGYPMPCGAGYYYGPQLNYGFGVQGFYPGYWDYRRPSGYRYGDYYYGGRSFNWGTSYYRGGGRGGYRGGYRGRR